MGIYDKEIILSFAEKGKQELVDSITERLSVVLGSTIKDLEQKNPYITFNKSKFLFVNEYATNNFSPVSEIIIFLSFQAPQIEQNTIKLEENFIYKVSDRFRIAYENSRRKKKKKKKKNETIDEIKYVDEKYTMNSLKIDIFNIIVKYLLNTSICYMQERRLRIIGKDEFGIPINIYPVLEYSNKFKFYTKSVKGNFITIDFANRLDRYEEKLKSAGENFPKILRIFNTLFYNLNSSSNPNQIFMEGLLYNVPNVLFKGDTFDSFIKILNYLNMTNIDSFKSILTNKNLFKDKLNTVSLIQAKNFIKEVSRNLICEEFDED